MICPRCHKQMLYIKSLKENVYYYECRRCGYSIGKPAQEEDETETEEVSENAESEETAVQS